ncbi:MAG: hypothetical protein RLW87_05045 [Alphaproteobacteria bacterium]
MDNDEHHAIWQVLAGMVWNEVAFNTLAEIADSNSDSSLNNPLIVEAILEGHIAVQVLAIRRLTDTTKRVISLSNLIKDVRKNRNLLTRENYVAFDGLPYEYEDAKEEHLKNIGTGFVRLETTGSRAFWSAQRAHEQFDRLSGVRPDQRKRDDRIPATLFDTIESWIKDCGAKEIANWSHNFLAHAGSLASREENLAYDLNGAKISNAIKGLAQATEAVSAYILYSSGRMNSLMATPQYDQFQRLENAAMSNTSKIDPVVIWAELSREYENALQNIEGNLVSGSTFTA